MTEQSEIGRLGEDAAVEYLRARGFVIEARNWRHGRYEIDIIARRWDEIHFVEVKTRRAGGWTTPESAITEEKFRALKRAANYFLALRKVQEEPLFDLCAVDRYDNGEMQVRFIEGAMESHW